MGNKQLDLLDKTKSPRLIVWALAWPTIVEQLLMTVVTYVDAAMVGSVGVDATASVAVNTTVIWLLQGIMAGLGVGASVLIAKKIGENRKEEVQSLLVQSLYASLILGIVMAVVGELILAPYLSIWMGAEDKLIAPASQYMRIVALSFPFQVFLAVGCAIIRGSGDTKRPMIYNMVSNIVNIIGNFFFIYETRAVDLFGLHFNVWGAGMGVGGAALGTLAAYTVAGSITVYHLVSTRSSIHIEKGTALTLNKPQMRQIINLGIPTVFERMTLSLGQIVITALVTGMGSTMLAAHQLATTAESICYMPCFGFSMAATTLAAQSLGAGEQKLAKKYSNICLQYGIATMVVSAVLMYVFAPQMISLFIRDAAVISVGAMMLRIEAFAEPFVAVANVVSGILKGGGDTKWPFYISLIGMWAIRLPMSLIVIKFFHVGLAGIWIPMAIDWVIRMIISTFRYKSEKWMHISF